MADETLAFDLLVRDKGATRTLKGVGDQATKTGKDFDKASDGAGKLGAQIDETTLRLKELGEEFDKTGDRSLLKDIGKERRTLSGLVKLRKEMAGFADDVGDVAKATATIGVSTGQGLFAGISGAFGPKGTTAITGGLVAAGVASAPAIGAALTGAIVAAVGSGAVAAGIASAARSDKVKAAWGLLAAEGKSAFSDFGRPFVEPTVASINILRGSLAEVRVDLDAIATDAAGFVVPLTRGIGGFVEEVVPGLRALVREGDPVFDMFETELPRVGRSVSDFFEHLSGGAEGGAAALRALLRITEMTLPVIGAQMEMWADEIELVSDAAGKLGLLGAPMAMVFGEEQTSKIKASGKASEDTFKSIFDGAKDAAEQVERLNQKFSDLFDKTMDLDQANVDYQLGLIELGETLKHNNETISDGTERQLRNQDAVLGMIDEVKGLRDATIAMGDGTQESTNKANAAYLAQLQKIREVAVAFGFPIGQIDALIARYAALAAAPNITKFVTIKYNSSGAPAAKPGQVLFEAKGGIVAAQHGMVTSSPTVLFGERQTGQEAFIPKLGISRQRGMALASQAAAWHGASVVANERMGSGGIGPLVLNYSGGGSGLEDMFVKWLHSSIREGRLQLSAGGSRVAVG